MAENARARTKGQGSLWEETEAPSEAPSDPPSGIQPTAASESSCEGTPNGVTRQQNIGGGDSPAAGAEAGSIRPTVGLISPRPR